MQIIRQFGPVDSLVASHLLDSALISLGTTCKTVHLVCTGILKQRDEHLQNMLSSYYTCINQYNIDSCIKADLICLGEKHGFESCQKNQKKIIHFLSTRYPIVVLLESLPSLKSFAKKDLVNIYQPIQLIARKIKDSNNIHYIGWDDEESISKIRDTKMKFEKPFQEDFSLITAELSQLKTEISEITQEIDLYHNKIDKIASNLGVKKSCLAFQSPKDYLSYIEEFLQETHSEEKKQIQSLIIKSQTIVEEQGLFEKIDQQEQLEDTLKDLKYLFEEAIKEDTSVFDILAETNPARTQKLIATVCKIKEYVFEILALKNAKIVLISGQGHLAIKLPDFKADVSHFHREASRHKAAVFIPTQYQGSSEGR